MFNSHAEEITDGDYLLVQENDDLTPEQVTSVSTFSMQGKYFSSLKCTSS